MSNVKNLMKRVIKTEDIWEETINLRGGKYNYL